MRLAHGFKYMTFPPEQPETSLQNTHFYGQSASALIFYGLDPGILGNGFQS